jgi:para-nitrobenzyl esterase
LGWHAKAFAIAGALLLQGTVARADFTLTLPTLAATDRGTLIGKQIGPVKQFLGIPYAAPPVGTKRWQPPAQENPYFLRDATRFAKHCAQPASPFGVASTSEDCLYLNVFAPASLTTLLRPAPVMVWFHPGAFLYGESDDYNPTELVKRGVVVVTVNYRLGALGFTAHPALTAEANDHSSGNYGFLDQQAALRWVKRNIRNFGGDPNSVTIFGESAGGVSVYSHLASPASAGLFQRAIAQSGMYAFVQQQPTLATAEATGQAFASALGCTSQSLACMRAASVSQVLSHQGTSATDYEPIVDGTTLTQPTLTALYTGQFNHVPIMQGTTHDEFRLFVATLFELQGAPVTSETYRADISAVLQVVPPTADTIATYFYPESQFNGSASLALSAIGTDAIFACPSRGMARAMTQYVPMFVYEFSDADAPQDVLPPVSFPYGAYHGSEVQYLLDSPDGAAAFTSGQAQLANTMKSYWTQFARTSDPNGNGAPAWAAYQQDSDNGFQQLVAPTPQPSGEDNWLYDHRCLFWTGY